MSLTDDATEQTQNEQVWKEASAVGKLWTNGVSRSCVSVGGGEGLSLGPGLGRPQDR